MELPQSRTFGTEGRKPTHDFLSLYSSPPQQQDPRPSPQGTYLETHDFLQPLDRVGKNIAREGNKIEVASIETPPPPAAPSSVEHTLPGGIGTYSISHVSFINQNQRVPKPEGGIFTVAQSSSSDRNDENSNCSSYTGSGFTLWEESAIKKGKTGKENIAGDRQVIREAGMRIGGGQWTPSLERPSLSSSNHNHHSKTTTSLSSSRPSSAPKNQSFVDMIKSARNAIEDDDDDEEEFVIKKEPSFNHKGNLSVKVDTKGTDQKPNTPRSKHSATEQRRRSKINDRFSMLRELIPHSDQKRDKASFLLEVIEYIQYLQEKVHKYEDSPQGWNNGPPKLIPWVNSQRPSEGFIDQPRVSTSGSPLVYSKFDENTPCAPPTIPRTGQNLLESNINSVDTIKDLDLSRLTKKSSPFPALQSNIFSPGASSNSAAPLSPRLQSATDNGASQSQSQLWNIRSCLTDCSDKLKEQELTIDSGTISVSTMYSQGLLNTLTNALQNSGVDLSQASISVQIDLGKRANSSTTNSSTSMHKKHEHPLSNQELVRSRLASSTGEECDVQALKRFKTGIS